MLAGFFDANSELGDAYADEKIFSVQTYFQILCGIGEDHVLDEQAISNLHSSIAKLEKIISTDGLSLSPPGMVISRTENDRI